MAAAAADSKAAPAAVAGAATPAAAAKPAESGPKKAKDGKLYEAGALPNAWVEKKGSGSAERVIWMLTIADPKPLGRAAGAAAAASTDSRMDPSTGLLFPDVFYVLGERVSVGKKDGMNLAKCFKGTANDTAEWPSGLVAVKCGRCDAKLDDGVMTIQKHMRLIGKTGEKKITCRMMPRLLCDACYQYACDATAGGAVALPAAAKLVAHKSYWTRWSELQPLVTVLSEDFVKSMSSRVGGGRTAGAMTTDEHGVQTVKLVKADAAAADAKAASAPAALTTEQQQQQLQALLHQNLFTPAASTTPVTPAIVAAAAAGAKLCGGCSKAESADAAAPRYAACGRCGGVWYCGKDCQKAHWKTHKNTCVAAK